MSSAPPAPSPPPADGSESEDEYGGHTLFGKLFLNEAYAECALSFGEQRAARTLRLAVSSAACTDHDLTGQLTWPGARLLARWLAAQPDAFFAAGSEGSAAALELGAGTGLAGLYYAARGGDVVLTDYHPVVMALLRSNEGVAEAAACEAVAAEAAAAAAAEPPAPPPPPPLPPAGAVRVAKLLWGDAGAGAALVAATPHGAGFHRLLGADILYPGSQRALPGLMASVCQLLAPCADSALYLCYCSRAATTDAALHAAIADAGLVSHVAPGGEAVAEGGVEGVVYRITRKRIEA
jgi:hypothetical protein